VIVENYFCMRSHSFEKLPAVENKKSLPDSGLPGIVTKDVKSVMDLAASFYMKAISHQCSANS